MSVFPSSVSVISLKGNSINTLVGSSLKDLRKSAVRSPGFLALDLSGNKINHLPPQGFVTGCFTTSDCPNCCVWEL
jgi:hypothetical protein